jgi:HSP20 family protein
MFFTATAHPQLRRHPFAATAPSLERFMSDALRAGRNQPATFTQDDTTFTLSFDVPGVTREDLSIALEGAVVRITSKEGAARNYRAAYELPQEIDTTQSQAKLENGVLTLKLAKLVPVSTATELPIQ